MASEYGYGFQFSEASGRKIVRYRQDKLGLRSGIAWLVFLQLIAWFFRLATDLAVRSFARPDRRRCGAIERWGVQMLIRAGVQTFIEGFRARSELALGLVRAGEDARLKRVMVRIVGWLAARPEQVSANGSVDNDGLFRVLLPEVLLRCTRQERIIVAAFYDGISRHASCRSPEVGLER